MGACGSVKRVVKMDTKIEKDRKEYDFQIDERLEIQDQEEMARKLKIEELELQDLDIEDMINVDLEAALNIEMASLAQPRDTKQVDAILKKRRAQLDGTIQEHVPTEQSLKELHKPKRKMKQSLELKLQQEQIQKMLNRLQQYDLKFLEHDDLLEKMMSFRTKQLMQEKKCEPSPCFPLKNSDELLWEDQTEYLNNIVLNEYTNLHEYKDHLEIVWEGSDINKVNKRYQITINILRMVGYAEVAQFENVFFASKKTQQRLALLKADSFGLDCYNFIYHQQLFRIQYGYVFLRVNESRDISLFRMLQIRQRRNEPYEEAEIVSVMVTLLKAVRDANEINISHGIVNDENVYVGHNGKYRLGDFGIVKMKKVVLQERALMAFTKNMKRSGQQDPWQDMEYGESLSGSEESEVGLGGSPRRSPYNRNKLSMLGDMVDSIQHSYTLSYEFHKYEVRQYKPRHQIFWSPELRSLFTQCLSRYYENDYEAVKDMHNPERNKYLGTEEENDIQDMLLEQDVYSIAIVALQMMTLGVYEFAQCGKLVERKGKQYSAQLSKENYYIAQSSLSKSMYGMPSQYAKELKEIKEDENAEKSKLLDQFRYPNLSELNQLLEEHSGAYPLIVPLLQSMIQPDPRQRADIRDLITELSGLEVKQPADEQMYHDYRGRHADEFRTHFDEIIANEKKNKLNVQILAAFDKEQFFTQVRRMYYKALGYMLIRNFELCLKLIERLHMGLQHEKATQNETKMRFYQIRQIKDLFLSNSEDLLLQLMQGICQIECRQLGGALQTLMDLEAALLTAEPESLKYLNAQIPKFYQGVATYYSGEPEDAMLIFNRVLEMSKGELKQQDINAYFHFTKLNVLLQLDSDGYFKAFKMLEEIIHHQEEIQIRDDYITMDMVAAYYFQGKAYFQVSQFQLSASYFLKAYETLRKQVNISTELIALKLKILGYLSYLHYLKNDMHGLSITLSESISILNALLRREEFLETVIVWLNLFGFLLSAQLKDEDLHQFLEVFDLIVQKNEARLNIDIFFKNYVFAKLYYFSTQYKKSQKLFLETLEMHQYFYVDDLRIPQTQNISTKQLQQQALTKIAKLNANTKKQCTGGPNLPAPEKDNLTIRIVIEIYDWLGFLYERLKDTTRAVVCYAHYEEFALNLIEYDLTLSDEYMLRIAKIYFLQRKYKQCLEILRQLSIDLKKQVIDDALQFQYTQIQSEIQLWMGTLYMMFKQDGEAQDCYHTAKEELYKLMRQGELTTEYDKNHQVIIIVLLIQLYLRMASDCLALGYKERALHYLEELITLIQRDKFFSNPLFYGYIKQSQKVDLFFLFGYLYGLNEQHENATVYYEHTFVLLQTQFKSNSLDQLCIEHMSLIYDQMGRVFANQGFYSRASKCLHDSIQMMIKIKSHKSHKTSDTQLAYKLANIGAIEFRCGNYDLAAKSIEQAIKLFEREYGKASVPVYTARVKLLEIKMHSPNILIIRRLLLKLMKAYQNLPTQTLRLEGQLCRLTAIYSHRMGRFNDAFKEYSNSFARLLDDGEVAQHLLSKELDDANFDLLILKLTDRAALEVAINIAQLYLDNSQNYQAYKLAVSLSGLFQGEPFSPCNTNQLKVLGIDDHDHDDEGTQILKGQGILANIPCLMKSQNADKKITGLQETFYSIRGNQLLAMLKQRKSANILSWGETLRIKGQILNNWQRRQAEPYFYSDYEDIVKQSDLVRSGMHMFNLNKQKSVSHKNSMEQVDIFSNMLLNDNINPEDYLVILEDQKRAKSTMIDALIIYQESIGVQHAHFAQVVFQLAERQFLLREFDEVDLYYPEVILIVKENSDDPILIWQSMILQAKIKFGKNKFTRMLFFLMSKVFLSTQSIKNIVILIKQQNPQLEEIFTKWVDDEDPHNVVVFNYFMRKELEGHDWTLPQDFSMNQIRDVLEGQSWLKRATENIQKTRVKMDQDLSNGQTVVDKKFSQMKASMPNFLNQIEKLFELTNNIIRN